MIVVVESIFSWAHIGEQEFVRLDPELGFAHIAGKHITFRQEGFSQGCINKSGFRDYDYPVAKPKDVIRIAVLGDSKAEALQVPLSQTFAKILEQKLNALKNGKYQVLNFGMSGYSTGQEYLLYLHQVATYKPNIVILAYHIGDSDENVYQSNQMESLPRPFFFLDKENKLWADMTKVKQSMASHATGVHFLMDYLRCKSKIVGVLCQTSLSLSANKAFVLISRWLKKPSDWLLAQFDSLFSQHSSAQASPQKILLGKVDKMAEDGFVYRTKQATNEAQAYLFSIQSTWPVTREILLKLNSSCNLNQSRLVVAALPAPNNSILYFKELKYIEGLAKSAGFQFVNVHRAFPSLKAMERSPLYFNFHFSAKGHKLVADTLFQALVNKSKPSTIFHL